MQKNEIGKMGKFLLIMVSAAVMVGCTSRTYNSIKLADEDAKVIDHKFVTPQGFKKIAGNKYPIPAIAGKKSSAAEDKDNGVKAGDLSARTADDERISILPPGSHF